MEKGRLSFPFSGHQVKDVLKLLFPEYQIKACVDERGFIAKSRTKKEVAQRAYQESAQGSVRQQIAPEPEHPMPDVVLAPHDARTDRGTTKTYKPAVEDNKPLPKANDVFEGLAGDLKKYWVGSEKDRGAICKAYQRPYVSGFDNRKPKNTILLIGSESRGRVYAVRCVGELLKQRKVFRYSEAAVMDFADYAADSSNALFLSDLYKSLNTNTETVVFENIEKASLAQREIIYPLLKEGAYKLQKRYTASNGSLVESTGVLNTEHVSEITANGKFFVFTASMPQAEVFSFLGNKFLGGFGDVITLDPIDERQVRDLAYTLCVKLAKKCSENLHVNAVFDDGLLREVGRHYRAGDGVRGFKEHIESNLYDALSEMKLQGRVHDGESVRLTYEDGYCVELEGGEKARASQFLKNYSVAGLEEARKELDQVIGLEKVKEYVLGLETNFKVQQMREGRGLKKSDIAMHMIFAGNPGTGKTTIARIVAKYLKAIGVLSSGHLCEVTRADLVGQYAGHTAVRTSDVIKSALGGVLFIDEAYSLCRDRNDVFGLEAIDTLVKGMEDYRESLVVILAGYEDEMQEFMKTNPGLKSRFPNVVHFEDYSVDDMYEIARLTARSKGYRLSDECGEGMRRAFEKKQIKGRNDGGNGRLVRNLIESAVLNQSQRVVRDSGADMELLIPSDFGFDKSAEFDLEKSLAGVIGMEEVKRFIRTQYTMLQADKKRRKANIDVDVTQSLNMIFAGNPGTGKTTMARIVADMLHSMDILKSGHLVEADKGALVAQYVGQTARKTEEVFRSALGGVLFIDEAYAIAGDGGGFGQECIDTLVKLIEDYRGETVVILAGYSREMRDFLKANSGLESRFPLRIDFPDYSAAEMSQIGKRMISDRGFVLADSEAQKIFEEETARLKRHATASSGNGRMVRNFVEDIIRRQSCRIAREDVPSEGLTTILPVDVRPEQDNAAGFDLEKELSKVIGLDSVKKYIRGLNARLKLEAERKKAGLKTDNTQTMHMIFAGNPGTGKTMMARTVADVLYHMNAIQSNKLVETDRSGLVAGYVGQTAMKTREVVETALGGVLFVDEAYALAQGGENDFGREAIDTLVKMMDDNRDRLVVILAGYSEDMRNFLNKNAGLQSRFANIIEFADYSTDELMQIAEGMYTDKGYVLSDGGRTALRGKIEAARKNGRFGNGRYVRNVLEGSLNNQALRLSAHGSYTKEALTVITENDIEEVQSAENII